MASGNRSIPADPNWHPARVDDCCRNWVNRVDGAGQVRMSTAARALAPIAACVNHLAAMQSSRVHFAIAHPIGVAPNKSSEPTEGADNQPTHRWKTLDYVDNARERRFRAYMLPRESDPAAPSDQYFARTDNSVATDSATTGAKLPGALGRPAVFDDRYQDEALFQRGAAPAGRRDEGIATFNDARLYSAIVQDVPLAAIDTDTMDYVPSLPVRGDPVLGASVLERIASVLDELRRYNRPTVLMWGSWASQGNMAGGGTIGANNGHQRGVRITDTANFRNVLKPSSASAAPAISASAPGWPVHLHRCGIGTTALAVGRKVRIDLYVLARAVTDDGTVRALGSSSFASNTSDIAIAAAGGLAWYGTSNYVWADASLPHSDTTSARGKVELWGKASGAGELFVYGAVGLVAFGL